MTRKQIAVLLAKLEGKKSEARIGDIQELLKLICVLEATYRIDIALKTDNSLNLYSNAKSKVMSCLNADTTKMALKGYKKMLKKKK